ncbi:MAG: Cro/CI family transcriptional regulator [Atlantibacter hermannii]|uniref:Cro/CI family transcriptional regulator n=1 Tax=Atlantibacter hermannii TaxID=565 RepID=UPI0028A6E76D|nr:Cro/CI family transcriptional regulator [Atlantibacter hermannii]MDU1950931.1 Cro/CI family transcriptional regulator [Atlantibacter hermannii]
MHKLDVVEHFGGISKTASALGISHPAVCRWGEIIPEKQAFVIERITKGKLKYDSKLYQKTNETDKQP